MVVYMCMYRCVVCYTVMLLILLRLNSLQYDLGQQIRVDFEKAFSVKGITVRLMHKYKYCGGRV